MGIWDSIKDLAGPVADVVGGAIGSSGAQEANKNARREAVKQRDWEEKMSNTAVQRRMDDLKAAGVNPLLGMSSGQVASTPSSSAAPMANTKTPIAEGVRGAAHSAASIAQMENLQATTRKLNADASVTEDSHDFLVGAAGQTVSKLKAEISNIGAQESLTGVREATQILENGLRNMDMEQKAKLYPLMLRELEANTRQAEAGVPGAEKRAAAWKSWLGTVAAYAELATPMVNSALGAGALGKVGSLFKGGNTAKKVLETGTRSNPGRVLRGKSSQKPPPGSWERFLSE